MKDIKLNKAGYHLYINFKDERLNLYELNKDLALMLELTIKEINKRKQRS